MTKTTTQPTVETFRQFSREIAPAARAVVMAQAHAQLERERVNAYVLPILLRYAFVDGMSRDSHKGAPITNVDHLYLSTDEARVVEFFAECDAAHRANGFTGPVGHCPALVAENLQSQTERAFLKLAGEFFGAAFEDTYGDNRKKALDLMLGAALKAGKKGGR